MTDELPVGAWIAGRYRVEGPLGSGGMSRVYRAADDRLGRPVALKVLNAAVLAHAARFEREARAAAALVHPSVVRVHDFGLLDDGRHFLVLELVEAPTLAKVLQDQGALGARRAVHLLLPIAGALAEAHAAGIIHRDLKPENLLWQRSPGLPEWLRLLDFGIAAVEPSEGESRLTQTGEVFGTPEFMSPEQALARPVTPATDVWAMGAVLHTLVTGTSPFRGGTPPEVLFRIVKDPPAPLPDDVPAPIRDLVAACLAKEPMFRPVDGAALLRAMESLVAPVASVVGEPTVPMARESLPAPLVEPPSSFAPPPLLPALPVPVAPAIPHVVGPPQATQLMPPARARFPRAAVAIVGFGAGVALAAGLAALSTDEAPATTPAPAVETAPPPTPDLADAERLLENVQPRAALAWLEAHPTAGSPARRLLLRGFARVAVGEVAAGIADLAAALSTEPAYAADPRLVRTLLAQLDHRDGDGAVALLAGPLAERARTGLMEAAGGPGYRARWRAVEAIDKSGGDVHAAKLAALRRDLRTDDCDVRLAAIRKLAQLGDPAAIPDIQRAADRSFLDNLCMGDAPRDAIRTLRKSPRKASAAR